MILYYVFLFCFTIMFKSESITFSWRSCTEDRNHLFFLYCFTKRIWKYIMSLCLISDPKFNWLDLIDWSVIHLKGKSLRAILCKLAPEWRQKNAILRTKRLYTEGQLIRVIIRCKIECKLHSLFAFHQYTLKSTLLFRKLP